MLDQGHITHADFVRANKAPLPKPEDVRLPTSQNLKAPYFTNYVKQLLVDALRLVDRVRRRPARAHVDQPACAAGRARRDREVARLDRRAERGARRDGSAERPRARDGRRQELPQSQFNLAVQGERQPGSSFKPFVLATALEEGIAPGTTFVSRPITLFLDGTTWPVDNYEGSYLGTIDLQQATIHSDNSVFGQLTKAVGPNNVVHTAHRLGISSPLRAVPLDRARRARRSTRSRWRARSARSRTAASASTARSKRIANRPRAILAVGGKSVDDASTAATSTSRCNTLRSRRVLREDTVAAENSILQRVVTRGDGHARRAAGPPRGRQDGHDRELRRRLVRRLHAATRHGGLGRLPEQARPDDEPVPRRSRRRRNVPRDDLEDLHAARAARAGRSRTAMR